MSGRQKLLFQLPPLLGGLLKLPGLRFQFGCISCGLAPLLRALDAQIHRNYEKKRGKHQQGNDDPALCTPHFLGEL